MKKGKLKVTFLLAAIFGALTLIPFENASAEYCYCIGGRAYCMGAVGKRAPKRPNCASSRSAVGKYVKVPVGIIDGKTVYKVQRQRSR